MADHRLSLDTTASTLLPTCFYIVKYELSALLILACCMPLQSCLPVSVESFCWLGLMQAISIAILHVGMTILLARMPILLARMPILLAWISIGWVCSASKISWGCSVFSGTISWRPAKELFLVGSCIWHCGLQTDSNLQQYSLVTTLLSKMAQAIIIRCNMVSNSQKLGYANVLNLHTVQKKANSNPVKWSTYKTCDVISWVELQTQCHFATAPFEGCSFFVQGHPHSFTYNRQDQLLLQ